ncbi:MAG: hypothetical protein ACI9TF_001617, partial [Paracrocinitomix sp.]
NVAGSVNQSVCASARINNSPAVNEALPDLLSQNNV